MLLAVAYAAGTWTHPACRQPGWFINLRQDHPYRLSTAIHGHGRSHQRRYRTSSKRGPPTRL